MCLVILQNLLLNVFEGCLCVCGLAPTDSADNTVSFNQIVVSPSLSLSLSLFVSVSLSLSAWLSVYTHTSRSYQLCLKKELTLCLFSSKYCA